MDDIDDRIERWFAAHFHGSPHMRDTDTYNHVRAAVDTLKAELAGAFRRDADSTSKDSPGAPPTIERRLGD